MTVDGSRELREYAGKVTLLFNRGVDEIIPVDDFGICSQVREMLTSGKKIRPILTVLSHQAVGGGVGDAIPLAIAIELTHNATLIHDDIIDGDTVRRGELTLQERLGVNEAITIGDAMISLAVNIAADYGSEITKFLSKYGFDLCAGEMLDISSSLENASKERYLLKVKKKSAALFKASTHMGALSANGPRREVESLANFGEDVGIAYQIKDDIIDVKGDLRNGVVTLPIIHLYEKSTHMRNILKKKFGSDMDEDAIEKIISELNGTGSVEYCDREIKSRVDNAKRELHKLRDSEFKERLLEIPDFVLNYLERGHAKLNC